MNLAPTIEELIETVLAACGDATRQTPLDFARSLLGDDAIRLVRYGLPGGAALTVVDDRFYILVEESVPVTDIAFLVAHEIAEFLFYGREDAAVENDCDRFGEALVARLAA